MTKPKPRIVGAAVSQEGGKVYIVFRTLSEDGSDPVDFSYSVGPFDFHSEAAEFLRDQADRIESQGP